MNVNQALQELQRLQGLYQNRQISPEAYVQAVNQLQIVDAAGGFWHVDGASQKWFRHDGQAWVEQPAPFAPVAAPPPPAAPGFPPPAAPPAQLGYLPAASSAPSGIYAQRPGVKRASPWPWIGLGVLTLLIVVVVGLAIGGAFNPPKNVPSSPLPSATLAALAQTITPAPLEKTATPAPVLPSSTLPPSPVPTQTARVGTATITPPRATPTLISPADLLRPEGPWLLSRSQDMVYLVQAKRYDSLNTEKVVAPYELAAMIAPKGGHAAFITSPDPNGIQGLKLTIYNLATMKAEKTIALTSPKTEPPANSMPGSPVFEAIRSILSPTSIAWSPDGRRLAFIAVIDGPSSDLYVYSLDTQKVTRLTDGPSQGFAPSWSPDGKYIVQFGANGFGTGAGYAMAGAWATRADTGESISLFVPKSSGEDLVGWVDANTFLVNSWSAACGNFDLRAVSIQPLKVTPVFNGCFNQPAFDSSTGMVILGITQGMDYSNTGRTAGPGLYLVKLDGTFQRLNTSDVSSVAFIKNGAAAWGYVDKQGPVVFSLAGKNLPLPGGVPPVVPLVSPNGKNWAWPGTVISKMPGVWTGSSAAANKVADAAASAAAWSPSGNALAFLTAGKIFFLPEPNYTLLTSPVTIPPGIELAWAAP